MFDLWSKKIKIDEKSYKNILIFHIEYVMVKNLNSIIINSVNPLYIVINKINWYIEKSNGKRLTKRVWRTMEENQRSY